MKYINKQEGKPIRVYCVFWQTDVIRKHEWKHKDFVSKKEAIEFAKNRYNEKKNWLKPYIIKYIQNDRQFKEGLLVESGTYAEEDKLVRYCRYDARRLRSKRY